MMESGTNRPISALALDLASNCGWARVRGAVLVSSGTWDLKGQASANDHADKLRALQFKLHQEDEEHHFDVIFYEELLGFTGSFMSMQAVKMLRHYEGILICEARNMGIPIRGIPPSTLKSKFAGNGRAKKADMIAQARSLGWKGTSHDEADAVAVAFVGMRGMYGINITF